MQPFKYKYSIHNFIICLESIKLYQLNYYHLQKLHQKDIFHSNKILLSIYTIVDINVKTKNEKYRIYNILRNYSLCINNQNKIFFHQYLQRFTYKYKKYHKHNLNKIINKSKKLQTFLRIISLTYIYIIYKFLNTKTPWFIYYKLIQRRKL